MRGFKLGMAGTGGALLLGFMVLLTLAGLVVMPHDPIALDFTQRLAAPSAAHWLGTDQFGRDVLSRVMLGGRGSLLVASLTVLLTVAIGLPFGALVAYVGGWFERLSMTVLDALLAFPSLLIALGIMAVIGPSTSGVVMALTIAYTPGVVRVTRSVALSLRETGFVQASEVLGWSTAHVVCRHVIPNCIAPIAVMGASLFAAALLAESALSFLGVGLPPPAPTWGGMLADGRPFLSEASWLSLFPGLAIAVSLLGCNLLGDALRDRLDPRMRSAGGST
ncbi:ABC transporter permease [Peristeroidobacter soli]|jgi:peptide/nickel transport system permease protein|uniref:ABC transporter permease n=1 Tax=Peristeroidobacter soli TaxID=2497877 RepID=UPI00101B8140|nr:ABC transporter permease [Peristeroidobacter soli]